MKKIFSFVVCLLLGQTIMATRYYVDANGTNPTWNTATSWAMAYSRLDVIMANASDGDEIWVKSGDYYATMPYYYFSTLADLDIYGGFAGWETLLSQRVHWDLNPTRLFATPPPSQIYSDYVVWLNGANSTLDGFIIDDNIIRYGCLILGGDGSKQVLSNLLIRNNTIQAADDLVSLIYCEGTDGVATLFNIEITGNSIYSNTIPVAVIGTYLSRVDLINVTMSDNIATLGGLAVRSENTDAVVNILNSIIWDNDASPDAAIKFWSFNTAQIYAQNSDIQLCGGSGSAWALSDVIDGGKNIDEDPVFVNPTSDIKYADYSVKCDISLSIDAGDNSFIPTLPFRGYDLRTNTRVVNYIVDMGAYECQNNRQNTPKKDNEINNISVFPTMLKNEQQLNILINNYLDYENLYITVQSLTGVLLNNTAISKDNTLIDVPFIKGVYIISLFGNDKLILTEKIIRL